MTLEQLRNECRTERVEIVRMRFFAALGAGVAFRATGVLEQVATDDWAPQTIPAWRHSVWVGVWDPWPVVRRPRLWWKVVRDAWCLEVMHRAFTKGLMQYGMMTASKEALVESVAAESAPAATAA